ncbi:primosomal protein N' [Candidatus Peregrinibacteria bacterium CG_4_9_14_0_2_um_filter_53_11]|nr:MAG: primosomal protein N' [Candidatus Peregrinibacteria bacterium CG_4_9_14_0_2_um_filter_53_11]
MPQKAKIYAEVVLHRRVPKSLSRFTYEIDPKDPVVVGQIVHVPFKAELLPGVVFEIHRRSPRYEVRGIERVEPVVLDKRQLALIAWLEKKYSCSTAQALELCLSEKIWEFTKWKERLEEVIKKKQPTRQKEANTLAEPYKKRAQLLLEKKTAARNKPHLLLEKTPLDRAALYAALRSQLKKDESLLVLVPEQAHAELAQAPGLIFHSGVGERERGALWGLVRHGGETIIGTRAALFLPYKKIGAIIVDQEQSESYQELRAPRYYAPDVALKLGELHDAPVIFITNAPSVETWYKARQESWPASSWNEPMRAGEVQLIDMHNELPAPNGIRIFAQESLNAIARSLALKEQVLVFANRRGQASALFCKECSSVVRCPTCLTPLTLHRDHSLKCHHCGYAEISRSTCPQCGDTRLIPLGFGTQKLEDEMNKIFAQAKTLRLDTESLKNPEEKAELTPQALAEADILVSTAFINKPFYLPRLKLSIALLADMMLNIPHFRAGEQALQQLRHLQHLTQGGELIIQSYLPDNVIYQSLKSGELTRYYKEELRVRKELELPPYGQYS